MAKNQVNLKNLNRRDFWNLLINPVTGYRTVTTSETSGKNIQPNLKASYSSTYQASY